MVEKKKYEVRQLKTSDVFKMSKILKKINLNISVEKGMTQEQVGFAILNQVVSNLHLAEKEVSEFLGDMVGISGKEFEELPIDQSLDIINQFKNLDGIESFLKLANK